MANYDDNDIGFLSRVNTTGSGSLGRAITPQSFARSPGESIHSFKKGGKVKRTGVYKLHKGEHVVPVRKGRKR